MARKKSLLRKLTDRPAEYITYTSSLVNIANAIRTKGKTSADLQYPDGFITAIENISTEPPLDNINISTNGQHNVTDYKQATVAVPIPDQGTLNITKQGDYDCYFYEDVHVEIPTEKTVLTTTIGSTAATSISFTGFEHIPQWWNLGLRSQWTCPENDTNKYILAGVSNDPYGGGAQMEEANVTGNGSHKQMTIYHDTGWSWEYNSSTNTLTITNSAKDVAYFAPSCQYALSYYNAEHMG